MGRTTDGGPPVRHGEHLCRTYADESQWARQVGDLLREGIALGQQVLYYAHSRTPLEVTARVRADGRDLGAAVEREQVRVHSAADSYLRRLPLDPDLMIAGLRDSCRLALAQGWSGLRVIGEMDWAAQQAPGADRLLEYELRLDTEVFADLPVTGICLYTTQAATRSPAALAAATHHDLKNAGLPGNDTKLTARPLRPGGRMRLLGSADWDSRTELAAVLAAVCRLPLPVVHVDLSGVDFIDTAATAALARATAVLAGQDRRLVLHHAPPSLRTVAQMFPDECRDLEMTA
ncbi:MULTISPECIES: MEDS domain-containing protein [unclassified Kitasatospora]|uniref:MEDS domain-containing protein n=1 Tax=unclassified Kitasatospora TaxID=2633591 RepID=UPI0033C39DCD